MKDDDYKDIHLSEIISDWDAARKNREFYSADFPQLDMLTEAVPINPDSKAAYVGDTTIAGLVRSIPRDSIQNIPTFAAVVNGSKVSRDALFGSFLLRRNVFNQDTFGKGLLSTLQIGTQQAIAHGYAPFLTATGHQLDDFGTTMKVLHYADFEPEPGIQDHSEASYNFITVNLTKSRVRRLYDAAKNNEKTSWNVEALAKLLASGPSTDNYSIYQGESKADKRNNVATYKFVTMYESGVGGKFITFCPDYEEAPLRVVDNKSKFGFPRIQMLVIDPAQLHPFGVSRVRLASPWQNLMNAFLQNITSMLLLNSKPPIMKRGRFTRPIQLRQGAVWEAQDINAKADLMTMDNGALQHFVPFSQQMTAQIQNIMGMPMGTVNGNSNTWGWSKTAPGVKMQERFQNSSINQLTSLVENFLRQYALSALDAILSEQSGEDVIVVDDEFKDALNRLEKDSFVPEVDPATGQETEFVPPIGEDNKFMINWDEFYRGKENPESGKREGGIETLSVEIEVSVSKDELDEKKRGDIQDMLTVYLQNAGDNPQSAKRVEQLTDMLLEKVVPEAKQLPMKEEQDKIPQESQVSEQVVMNQ